MSARALPRPARQAGLAAVEFALVAATILFPLTIGIMEFGRLVFYWNAATEATRLGARLAVVCDMDDGTIKSRMTALFPVIDASEIQIAYEPAGCTTTTCLSVKVEIARAGYESTVLRDYRTPGSGFSLMPTLPPFSTTLPRESMRSSFGPAGAEVANPVCE